jgi:hypothetical protein
MAGKTQKSMKTNNETAIKKAFKIYTPEAEVTDTHFYVDGFRKTPELIEACNWVNRLCVEMVKEKPTHVYLRQQSYDISRNTEVFTFELRYATTPGYFSYKEEFKDIHICKDGNFTFGGMFIKNDYYSF